MRPTRPSSLKPPSTCSKARASCVAGAARMASASTRMPSRASASTRALQATRSTSHISSTRSGAPLTKIACEPSGAWCSVAMKRCSDSNGIASRRGHSAYSRNGCRPAFIASVTSAASVGSPTTFQAPSSSCAAASLHNSPARANCCSLASARTTSCAVISFLVSVPVLSEQITVTAPSVSTAGSRRMIALRRAMRRTPIASATVMIAGSASGIAATAMPTAARNMSAALKPRSQ